MNDSDYGTAVLIWERRSPVVTLLASKDVYKRQGKSVQSTLANILRNVSLHAGSPVDALNARIEHGFRKAIQFIGVDPDDPRQVIWGQPFQVNHLSFNELVAGNPLHAILLVLAAIIIFVKVKRRENRILVWYSLGLIAAFVVFCALLKWQM